MFRTAIALFATALAGGIGIVARAASQEGTSMFRGGAAHTGVYRSAPLAHFGGLQWRV